MSIRSWLLGFFVGSLVGIAVAAAMTVADWRLNPAGVFHSELGTNWEIVFVDSSGLVQSGARGMLQSLETIRSVGPQRRFWRSPPA